MRKRGIWGGAIMLASGGKPLISLYIFLNPFGTSDTKSVEKNDAYDYFKGTKPENIWAGCGRA